VGVRRHHHGGVPLLIRPLSRPSTWWAGRVALWAGNDGRPVGYLTHVDPNRSEGEKNATWVMVLVAVLAGALPKRPRRSDGCTVFQCALSRVPALRLGAVFSFPEGAGPAFEGVYRYAHASLISGCAAGSSLPATARAPSYWRVEARRG